MLLPERVPAPRTPLVLDSTPLGTALPPDDEGPELKGLPAPCELLDCIALDGRLPPVDEILLLGRILFPEGLPLGVEIPLIAEVPLPVGLTEPAWLPLDEELPLNEEEALPEGLKPLVWLPLAVGLLPTERL